MRNNKFESLGKKTRNEYVELDAQQFNLWKVQHDARGKN